MKIIHKINILLTITSVKAFSPNSFGRDRITSSISRSSSEEKLNSLQMDPSGGNDNEYEKKNAAVSVLSTMMQEEKDDSTDPFADIDFDGPKFQKVPIETLARILDYELYNKEWFVTGKVNPIYFSDDFEFQDPDVQLVGIENYARGVYKLFDQETSRAEIMSVVVADEGNSDDTITVTWRLSGKVKIGPGLTIKPYICITDFKVDQESGLINYQEDTFDIPQWDILLSALFPFLIGKVTSPPAPPVERTDIPEEVMLKGNTVATAGFVDSIFGMFNKN